MAANRVIIADGLHNPFPDVKRLFLADYQLSAALHTYTPAIPVGYWGWPLIDVVNSNNVNVTILVEVDRLGGGTPADIVNISAVAPGTSIGGQGGGFPLIGAPPIQRTDVLRLTPANTGFSLGGQLFLFPLAGPLIPIFFSLASGDNTVYTCPAGKSASPIAATSISVATFSARNTSGVTRQLFIYHVPNGGTPGAGNLIGAASIPNNTASATFRLVQLDMRAGDTLVINSDGAGPCWVYGYMYELPVGYIL